MHLTWLSFFIYFRIFFLYIWWFFFFIIILQYHLLRCLNIYLNFLNVRQHELIIIRFVLLLIDIICHWIDIIIICLNLFESRRRWFLLNVAKGFVVDCFHWFEFFIHLQIMLFLIFEDLQAFCIELWNQVCLNISLNS